MTPTLPAHPALWTRGAWPNLDAIEACLLGNAYPSVEEYTINGRMLRRFNRAELLKEREYWRNEYKRELKAAGIYTENRNITFRFRG